MFTLEQLQRAIAQVWQQPVDRTAVIGAFRKSEAVVVRKLEGVVLAV